MYDNVMYGNALYSKCNILHDTALHYTALQDDLNSVHQTFKTHIQKYRPEVNLEQVATGETWLGSDALQLGTIHTI